MMYYLYDDEGVLHGEYKSPVAAQLRAKELERLYGLTIHIEMDLGC